MSSFSSPRVTMRMPVALLLVSSIVTGVALTANDASTARVETPAIGAWLGTDDTGVVSHVGPAGVDAQVEIRPPVGQLHVTIVDGQVVLSDEGGHVTRLDEASLSVAGETQLATSARLAGGGDRLYTIDPVDNTVNELNTGSLAPIGDPVTFDQGPGGIGLGDAVVDDDGRLFVADGADGSVVEMLGDKIIRRHSIADPGVEFDLAVTDAGAVVIDPSAFTIQVVGSNVSHPLPFTSAMTAPDHVDGTAVLPVLADSIVALVHPANGDTRVVDLDAANNDLGRPVVAGDRVLIPDLTESVLLVVDLDTSALADDITLPGQTSDFEVISDGEIAYVNDRSSEDVWIISPDGDIDRDDKFDPGALDEVGLPPGGSGDGTQPELPPPPSASPLPAPTQPDRAPPNASPPNASPPNTAPPEPPSTTPSPETEPPASTPVATTPDTTPNTAPPVSRPNNDDRENNTPLTGNGSVNIQGVNAGPNSASVAWSPPAEWLQVDHYLVRVLDDADAEVRREGFDADIGFFEADGLTNGVAYRFEITASSGSVDGPATMSAPVVPDVSGDGSVTSLVASAANGTVTATWGAPEGWYEVDIYIVAVFGPSGNEVDVEQVDSDVTTYTSNAVDNGTPYTMQVHAVGVDSQIGEVQVSDSVTPIALVPTGDGGVTITDATAGNGTADVAWDEPTNWYATTGYEVVVLVDSTGSEYAAASVSVSGTTATIGNLVNGETYAARVTALSDQGPAATATFSTPLTPLGNGAITGLTVVAGDGEVDASWTAPTGWSTVSGYIVDVNPGGFSQTLPATATTTTMTGLTNGQTYTLSVTATRASGPDGATVTSAPFAPNADVPSEPRNTTIATGIDSIRLTWSAPTSGNVGSYRVDAVPVNGSTPISLDLVASRTSVELRNLTTGLAYNVFIRAVHPSGTLGAAVSYNSVTPSAAPAAPGISAAPTSSADGTSVTLRWTAPNANGSLISNYLINGNEVGGVTVASGVSVPFGSVTHTVTGLQPDTEYRFTIRAQNGIGQGNDAAFANVTTATPPVVVPAPNAPRNLQGSGSLNAIDLSWSAPTANGATISTYELSLTGGGAVSIAATARQYQWASLASDTSYTFVLRARGSDGALSGPISVTTSTTAPPTTTTLPPVPAPSTPTGVNATVLGHTSIRVTWAQPNPQNTTSWRIGYNSLRVDSNSTSIDIGGLQPGTTYRIFVWALGPGGQSGSSAHFDVTTTTPPPIPAAPTGLVGFAEGGTFHGQWNAVAGATGYLFSIDGGPQIDVGNRVTHSVNGVSSFGGGSFTVWAYNSTGTGQPTSAGYIDICSNPDVQLC